MTKEFERTSGRLKRFKRYVVDRRITVKWFKWDALLKITGGLTRPEVTVAARPIAN